MVDYINNLRGDGTDIEITNPTTDNPVIRLTTIGDESGGGSDFGGIAINGVDKDGIATSGNAISSITF